jgi:hypothetical protein
VPRRDKPDATIRLENTEAVTRHLTEKEGDRVSCTAAAHGAKEALLVGCRFPARLPTASTKALE